MPLDIFGSDFPAVQLPLLLKGSHDHELVIDNFAGGGFAAE